MLAVFRGDVKKSDPLAPELPGPEYIPALKDGYLEKYFSSIYMHPVIVNLGTYGFMAYSADMNISPSPRPVFSMRSGIYCIYRGHMEMTENRKNAGEGITEVEFLMACFAGVKVKGNKTAFEAMQVLGGDYNYILYDRLASRKGPIRGAFAVNCWKNLSLYFGHDSEGCCIIADDVDIMKKVCGECFKLIPKGYGLLIPVLIKPESELVEASVSDDTNSDKEGAGGSTEGDPFGGSSSVSEESIVEAIEATSLDGCNSKKTSRGEVNAILSGSSISNKENDFLAIFDGRVAKRPECMKLPHKDAVSAIKDDFLVNHFTSVYPGSIVISSEASFTFAYSVGASSSSCSERYHFAHTDGIHCLYQGFIEAIDAVKKDFNISEIDDRGIFMIRAFQVLRRLGQRISKKAVEDTFGNCLSLFYEIPSKLVVLAGGCYHDLPVYWGIDARFNLVISSDKTVVEKACGTAQAFLSGQVYACCNGRTGHEALFLNNQIPYKLDFTDKYFPISRPVEAVSKMILRADKDRSKPSAHKWEPPMPDFLKINTDGIKFRDGMLGFGIVIRNAKGEVELALTRKAENLLPNLDPEIQAFMEGFSIAIGFKLRRCICESVHLNLGKMDEKSVTAIVELLVKKEGDCIKESFSELAVSFVSSSANRAAHRLALLGKTDDHIFWNKETPECIASIIESERPAVDTAFSGKSILLDAAEK